MPQKIIIAEQERIAALLSDERVDKLIVAQGRYQIGDIYLGTIENVLPGIDAAFVNIGASEKNGFIHVTDLGPLKIKKSSASITELLEPRQKVLVQVMKEPTGNKGPRLTGNIELPGRYLILQPNGQGVNISRQINIENERNRLKALGVLIKPPGTGLVIRSEAEEILEELIIEDLENLLRKWELIYQASEKATPPTLLNRDEDFIHRVLRDHVNPDLSEIVLETSESIERAKSFFSKEETNVAIKSFNQPGNLIEHFKIDLAILNALKPRVDLPSGGYIIIEPTEALTVIDVNSGSFTRSANSRETVLWTNCEAAIEIARQLQLRNIGGVIIIDFIDMESRRDQLQLLEYFTAAIRNDSSRPQISQLTELGLVELTRKRQGQNIYELFSKECPHCNGLGHVDKVPGKEEIKPSALTSGVIKTELRSNNEVYIGGQNNNIKLNGITNENASSNNKTSQREATFEQGSSKQESEQIQVRMNEDEEYVYSSLGLNPYLLIDKKIEKENILVEVIRLSDNEEINKNNSAEVESIEQSATSNVSQSQQKEDNEQANAMATKSLENYKEKTPNVDLIESSEPTTNSSIEDTGASLNVEQENDEPPRRTRRRSSANI